MLRGAVWQRCRTHFIRNVLTNVPKAAQGLVATFVRTIFAQPDAESVRAQHARTVEQLQPRFKDPAKMLAEAEEILAFTAFPKEHWSCSGERRPTREEEPGEQRALAPKKHAA